MGIQIIKPSSVLAPYIRQYWYLENCVAPEQEYTQRIIPTGLMELMFFLDGLPMTLEQKKGNTAKSLISGQQKEYYDLKIRGKLTMLSVTFQPYGAMMFFGIPLNEFSNRNIPLKDILEQPADTLESRLQEYSELPDRIRILEDFLKKQLMRNYKSYEVNRISHSLKQINAFKGNIPIKTLASHACLSRKQYERSFTELIGSTPKQFLRVIRFQNSIFSRQKNPDINLTQLACNCGYYDQSHMIADYRYLAGKTPRQFFAEEEVCSDYFSA
jgi:AraC-like DNA-binding protein